MKKYMIRCVIVFIIIYCLQSTRCKDMETTYTTRYDGVDIDYILENDRILSSYMDCLLDKGACTTDGKELKKNLPDAINNDCVKCSEKQRIGSEKVIHYIIDHKPEMWDELEKKYDSEGNYKNKYEMSKNSTDKDSNNFQKGDESKNVSLQSKNKH